MRPIEFPTDTVQQISARLPDGGPMLAVLAKRTYLVDAAGRLRVAPEQLPLTLAPELDPKVKELLRADTDMMAFKLRTDVIVLGHAYAPRRERRIEAVIRIAGHDVKIAVTGERRCGVDVRGNARIPEPAPIERVPLCFTHAYGGKDGAAEAKYGDVLADDPAVLKNDPDVDLEAASPYLYPRNPCGRGYLVEPSHEGLAGMLLPQLEDPSDLLTPARLAESSIEHWQRLPLPWSTGWVNHTWYPRIAFVGVIPISESFDRPPLEVDRGLVPEYLADGVARLEPTSSFELASGAHVALQRPHLRGGETIELLNLHKSRPRWTLQLPPPPTLQTDGRNGKLNPTEPVLHSVILEPDEDRVSVVWRGAAAALRPYAPGELDGMPLRVVWPA
jgi:hypothetical protein